MIKTLWCILKYYIEFIINWFFITILEVEILVQHNTTFVANFLTRGNWFIYLAKYHLSINQTKEIQGNMKMYII